MKLVSWAVAGGVAGWAAIRLTGADRARPIEAPAAALMSFTPYVVAAAPLALLSRRKGPAMVGGLAGAALGYAVLSRTRRRRQPPAHGQVLRVLTANVLAGRASEETVVDLVRRLAVDVLFVQELTDGAVTRLKQAGLDRLLSHEMIDVRGDGPRGSGIYARFPLSEGLSLAPIYAAQPTARLELPKGESADLVCVHPQPPAPPASRRRVAKWRAELGVLPPPATPSKAEPPRILAGDFNATMDHAQFRRLLGLGHVDAAAQTGGGLRPTWGPVGRPALLTLDHVLVDPRCAVLRTSVHPLPGSDHRAVFASFMLPELP